MDARKPDNCDQVTSWMHGIHRLYQMLKFDNLDLTIVMQILQNRNKVRQHFLNDKKSSIQKINTFVQSGLITF